MMVTLLVPYCLEMLGWETMVVGNRCTPPTKISGIDIENWHVWKEIYYIYFPNRHFLVSMWILGSVIVFVTLRAAGVTIGLPILVVGWLFRCRPSFRKESTNFLWNLVTFFWWCFLSGVIFKFSSPKIRGNMIQLDNLSFISNGWRLPTNKGFCLNTNKNWYPMTTGRRILNDVFNPVPVFLMMFSFVPFAWGVAR